MSLREQRKFSLEEYLLVERRAETRSEFSCGHVYAMSGGTFEHNVIAMKTAKWLDTTLGPSGCVATTSDMKVLANAAVYYPDVSVICGEPEFRDDNRDLLLNPTIIVEVLSPSTRAFTFATKVADYLLIPSIQLLLLVEQEKPMVEVYARTANAFARAAVVGLESVVEWDGFPLPMPLADVYEGVRF